MIDIKKNMSNEPQTLKKFRLSADIKPKLKAKESGLFDKYVQKYIKYKSDGTIYSDNKNIDRELNYVLNLNIEILKRNRRNAKIDLWNKLPKDKSWNREMINRLIEKYQNRSKKAPYLGVLLYFLKKKLK